MHHAYPRSLIALFVATLCLLLPLVPEARALPPLDVPGKAQQPAADDVALVIGIAAYPFVGNVPYADRDAQAFASYLLHSRGLSADRVRILLDSRATRESIDEGLRFVEEHARPGATVWVFFAGHGVPDPKGGALLAGADVQQTLASVEARSFSRDALVERLAKTRAARSVVLLDACFTGQSPDGAPLLEEGLRPLLPVAEVVSRADVLVFSAASQGETSGPLDQARQGLFSYFMIGGLRGWADLDGDGEVTAEELATYTRRGVASVLADGRRSQTPTVSAARGDKRLSWKLARGVTEQGPDLATVALASLEHPAGQPLRPATLGEVPALSGVLRPDGAMDFEVAPNVLVAYDRALGHDANGEVDPERAAASWDAVAELEGRNPFQEEARTRAEQWAALARERDALAAQRLADTRGLRDVLPLPSVPADHKARLLAEYAQFYGPEAMLVLMTELQPLELREELCRPHLGAGLGAAVTIAMPDVNGEPHAGVVYIDGQAIGQAPATFRVPPCAQHVEVRDEDGRVWTRPLQLGADDNVHLRPHFAGLIADGSPEDLERIRRRRPRDFVFLFQSVLAPKPEKFEPHMDGPDLLYEFGVEFAAPAIEERAVVHASGTWHHGARAFGLGAGMGFGRFIFGPVEWLAFKGSYYHFGTWDGREDQPYFAASTQARVHLGAGVGLRAALGLAVHGIKDEPKAAALKPTFAVGLEWGGP